MFIRKILSYLVCLFTPVSIVQAINDAAQSEELDAAVMEISGIKTRKE